MYKYELHSHTCGCSGCAVSTVEEMVRVTKEYGYSGLVITNHFYRGNTCVDRSLEWHEFVETYERDWLKGKEFGKALGIDVIFGVEEVYSRGKEVLIYGITPDEFKTETDFKHYNLEQISAFVRSHGGFLCHAHPFRDREYIPDPNKAPDHTLLDGVEVFNSCDPDNRNQLALEFADKYGLKRLSGGDIHSISASTFGTSGIAVAQRITDTKELASVLHSGDYRLIVGGKII